MWIVMTTSAGMPSSCRGRYRNVYLVELKSSWDYPQWNRPTHIRSVKIKRYRDFGHHNVGKTERCAYARIVAEAERRAYQLNNTAHQLAGEELLASWGGSA